MRNRIKILPQDVALKIAAGEVVERPASVVKELVENSIDGGADRIEVSIERGGIERVMVRDNGEGIAAGDAGLLFTRHATSKISDADDLLRVTTLGFRGEALTSIAQVSRVELISKRRGEPAGTILRIEGGVLKTREEAGAPDGTTVDVQDIFFNVPARRKFLRTPYSETSMITSIIERFAIIHPEIYFRLNIGARPALQLQAVKNPVERLAMIFGGDTVSSLVEFSGNSGSINVSGFASPPEVTNLRGSYLYVNGRFVRDRLIQRAIMKTYSETGERREPYFIIMFLNVPLEEVDVNVHPQKYEVRFRKPDMVFVAVLNALSRGFRKVIPETVNMQEEAKITTERYQKTQESLESYLLREGFLKYGEERPDSSEKAAYAGGRGLPFTRDIEILLGELIPKCQIQNKYLICESPEGIVIIDQHASHEMLTYHKLKLAYENRENQAQYLLEAEVAEVGIAGAQVLMNNKDLLRQFGFDLEMFSDNAVLLRSVPVALDGLEPKNIVRKLVSDMMEFDSADEAHLDELISRMACYGSVRAGQRLTTEEMMNLIDELRRSIQSPYCPHGRPVLRLIPMKEVETWFRRR